jgi:hypothetical protein
VLYNQGVARNARLSPVFTEGMGIGGGGPTQAILGLKPMLDFDAQRMALGYAVPDGTHPGNVGNADMAALAQFGVGLF